VALEYIGMVKFLECVYFPLQHFLFGLTLYGFDVNNFDGNSLFIFLIKSSVNDRAEALSDNILEAVRVIFNFFPKIII
jgi:hypothetical protein